MGPSVTVTWTKLNETGLPWCPSPDMVVIGRWCVRQGHYMRHEAGKMNLKRARLGCQSWLWPSRCCAAVTSTANVSNGVQSWAEQNQCWGYLPHLCCPAAELQFFICASDALKKKKEKKREFSRTGCFFLTTWHPETWLGGTLSILSLVSYLH